VPVGQTIALISAARPEKPVTRRADFGAAPAISSKEAPPATTVCAPSAPLGTNDGLSTGGRILASPKARRLALEQGLDLERLAEAGHAQPFHVKDLEALKALLPKAASGLAAVVTRHLTAQVAEDGFADFAIWAADSAGLEDTAALLAGLAGASFGRLPVTVAVGGPGACQVYAVSSTLLGEVSKADVETAPDLRVHDLRASRISSLQLGADECPVLSITRAGNGLGLTLECAGDHLRADEALNLLSSFAGRMEQPLRHLL